MSTPRRSARPSPSVSTAGASSAMMGAFRDAQALAARAVASFAVNGNGTWEDRLARIGAVRAKLDVLRARDTGAERGLTRDDLVAFFEAHATTREEGIRLSDALNALETDAADSAYLYGLAVGLALSQAGGVR